MKLYIIVGTRPEIIRLSEIIKLCKKYFETKLIHTGQNFDFELNEIFFRDLELDPPDIYLNIASSSLGETVGNVISKTYDIFKEERPDGILILGDTNSCLCAYPAKRLKIPIFHLEAGNRCFDINVPEEINRKIIDHLADINLCYTEHARRYLLNEGYMKEHVIVVHSPLREVINKNINKIYSSTILEKLNLIKNEYIVLSTHREENIDIEKNYSEIIKTIKRISHQYKIVFSVHPRTRKKLRDELPENVILLKPLGLLDYCYLQKNSYCTVSDSGTLTEESNILGFPAVLLRTSTERPEGVDKGAIIFGSIKEEEILNNIKMSVELYSNKMIPDYQDDVSSKVVKIIQSYIPVINEKIWRKL